MNHEICKKLEDLGWRFHTMGAEGPYYDYEGYRLQWIQQNNRMRSVVNINNEIPGLQNMQIFSKKSFFVIFFGYIEGIEEFKLLSNLLGIIYK